MPKDVYLLLARPMVPDSQLGDDREVGHEYVAGVGTETLSVETGDEDRAGALLGMFGV